MSTHGQYVMSPGGLQDLIAALLAQNRRVVGPMVREGAIVYDDLETAGDLPRGWSDTQSAGHYRLAHAPDDERLFAYNLGPQSFKKVLHPAHLSLFKAHKGRRGFTIIQGEPPAPLAILGARACEIAAIAIQDRVMLWSGVVDPHYASRRRDLLVVAVQCGQAVDTCFCPSMNSGPRVSAGYDLCLTELTAPHRFVVEVGSEAGAALVTELHLKAASDAERQAPHQAAAEAEAAITKRLPTEGLREKLLDALRGPHWDDVATRCLGCANCTMVCPTCFCTTITDTTALDGSAERERSWDSCFSQGFSYVHGGPMRPGLAARYRQWLTHKLATWWDQFDSSGCVGCGRCVTWCPAAIDITEEAVRAAAAPSPPTQGPS